MSSEGRKRARGRRVGTRGRKPGGGPERGGERRRAETGGKDGVGKREGGRGKTRGGGGEGGRRRRKEEREGEKGGEGGRVEVLLREVGSGGPPGEECPGGLGGFWRGGEREGNGTRRGKGREEGAFLEGKGERGGGGLCRKGDRTQQEGESRRAAGRGVSFPWCRGQAGAAAVFTSTSAMIERGGERGRGGWPGFPRTIEQRNRGARGPAFR